MVAGENGLANFVGKLTYSGNTDATYGTINLAAQKSRLGTIYAERTRVAGKYRLGITGGTLAMSGQYAANRATLAPSMLAGVTGVLNGVKGTPVGPVVTSIGNALSRTAANFDAAGDSGGQFPRRRRSANPDRGNRQPDRCSGPAVEWRWL